MEDRILVFIPMYNCEKQIVRVLNQFQGEINGYVTEVIFVNNCSTDNGESAVIKKLSRMNCPFRVSVLRNHENYGLGGSHKIAFQYAADHGFDYIIVLHGDDQGNIKDFLPLLHSGNYRKYDCCLGARFMRGSKLEGYSKVRILGNYGFNLLFSLVVKKRIYDLGSGLNLYKVSSLKNGYYEKFPDTLYFNDCMILAYCYYGQEMMFYPISWREEDQVSNNKLLKFSVSLLKMLFHYLTGAGKYLGSEMREKPVDSYLAECVFEKEEQG